MSGATDVLQAVADAERTYSIFEKNGWVRDKQWVNKDEEMFYRLSMSVMKPEILERAALLWISADMVDLLLHASSTLPAYEFQPSVLPWPSGFCVGAKPLYQALHPINGKTEDIGTVYWTDEFSSVHDLYVIQGLSRMHGANVLSPLTCLTLRPGTSFAELRTDEDRWVDVPGVKHPTNDESDRIGRILCALWLLIQQKVAVQRRAQPGRAVQRRWERDNPTRPVPAVTVVELRRPMTRPHEDSQVQQVEWSHRWIVDGHWRNQWHPTTNQHVPTWIAPHVKGPDDKPVIVKRKIGAWVR